MVTERPVRGRLDGPPRIAGKIRFRICTGVGGISIKLVNPLSGIANERLSWS
jgi:hypothetical protein